MTISHYGDGIFQLLILTSQQISSGRRPAELLLLASYYPVIASYTTR